jgi:hypothetical protein
MIEVNVELRKELFLRYADEGDIYGDEWFDIFFENASENGCPVRIDLEWAYDTDSCNFSSGDDGERIYSLSDNSFRAFWIATSAGGVQGPFSDYDGAVTALGYDPESFSEFGPAEDEED